MNFVDTNYFLRFLLEDVEDQYKEVKQLFLDAAAGKVKLITSTIVFFEIYWVLTSFYGKKKQAVAPVLVKLLKLNFILFEEKEILQKSVVKFQKTNLDLEDSYNIYFAKSRKVKNMKTFDVKLAKEFSR